MVNILEEIEKKGYIPVINIGNKPYESFATEDVLPKGKKCWKEAKEQKIERLVKCNIGCFYGFKFSDLTQIENINIGYVKPTMAFSVSDFDISSTYHIYHDIVFNFYFKINRIHSKKLKYGEWHNSFRKFANMQNCWIDAREIHHVKTIKVSQFLSLLPYITDTSDSFRIGCLKDVFTVQYKTKGLEKDFMAHVHWSARLYNHSFAYRKLVLDEFSNYYQGRDFLYSSEEFQKMKREILTFNDFLEKYVPENKDIHIEADTEEFFDRDYLSFIVSSEHHKSKLYMKLKEGCFYAYLDIGTYYLKQMKLEGLFLDKHRPLMFESLNIFNKFFEIFGINKDSDIISFEKFKKSEEALIENHISYEIFDSEKLMVVYGKDFNIQYIIDFKYPHIEIDGVLYKSTRIPKGFDRTEVDKILELLGE